jgi:hypothetical protein
MKFGLPISVMLHLSAVFGGVVFWSGTVTSPDQVLIIPLEIVTVGKTTNTKPTIKKTPETDPEPEIPPAQPPKEQTAVEDIPALPNRDKPEEPAFDLDALSAMVDTARQQDPDANTQRTISSETQIPVEGEHNVTGAGEQNAYTVNAQDYIKIKMKPCWPVDTGAQDYKKLRVEVRMRLDEYGEITQLNILNSAQIIASPNNAWRAARDKVLAALRSCAPYDGLFTLDYDEWKNMKLNFQPGDN